MQEPEGQIAGRPQDAGPGDLSARPRRAWRPPGLPRWQISPMREARLRAGLTLAALAYLCRIDIPTLSLAERGLYRFTDEKCARWRAALGLPADYPRPTKAPRSS